MLNVNIDTLKGKPFFKVADPNTEYTCIGMGSNESSGAIYVVGLIYDAPNNRTEIKSELLRDIRFKGDVRT